MKAVHLKPITPIAFEEKIKIETIGENIDFLKYFQPKIEALKLAAFGPYYWFIPNNHKMQIIATSDNIEELTIHKKTEWKNADVNFFAQNFHPDDRPFILSAIQMCMETASHIGMEKWDEIQINIYGKLLNSSNQYRWVLIQFPGIYFDNKNNVESALVMITDLGHLSIIQSPIMTMIDYSDPKNNFFKVAYPGQKIVTGHMPQIQKREGEVVKLMAQGFTTPQIASKLKIAYSTVENHKKNLRIKTNTKTSVELLNFLLINQLI